ncbi:MAG: CHAT domain-containing protein [Desulfobacterales bacterium]
MFGNTMNHLTAVILLIAGLATAFPQWGLAQEGPDEIEESGPRLSEEEAHRILAEALAPDAPHQKQVEYFKRRERAAFTLGDAAARLDALRRLVTLTEPPDKISPFIAYLWRELWRYGNQSEALEVGESLVRNRSATPEQRVTWTVLLGRDYVTLGNPQRAAELLKQVETEGGHVQNRHGPHSAAYTAISTDHLRAVVLQAQGDSDGALAAIRRSVDAGLVEVKRARAVAGASRTDLEYDTAIRLRNGVMGTAVWLNFAQGRSEEAEAIARLGLRLAAEEHTSGGTLAFWHEKLAQALLGERRFEEAVEAANKALAVYGTSAAGKSSLRIISTQTCLMQALFSLERWADADRLAVEMRAATTDDPTARAMVDNPVLQVFLHLKTSRVGQARERIDAVVSHRQRWYGENVAHTIEARAVRALVLQAQGAERLALDDYRAVFAHVFAPEKTFGDSQPAGVRGFYLPQALRGFMELVRERHEKAGSGMDEELVDLAFRVADRLQLSTVQQALIDSAARVVAATPDLGALVRREQEQRIKARETIADLNQGFAEHQRLSQEAKQRIAAGRAAQADAKKLAQQAAEERERAHARQTALKQLQEQLESVEKERGELQSEIGRRFPDYQSLVNPKPPSVGELAGFLAKDEAFVSLYPFERGTFVWGIGAVGRPALHVAALTAPEIHSLVSRLRTTLDLAGNPTPGRVEFDAASSHRLFNELLAPVWPSLGSPRLVTISTSSELAQLPFAVLTTQPPQRPFDPATAKWLLRETALNQIATAAAFRALRGGGQRPKPGHMFFGFGDPLFAGASATPGDAGTNRTPWKPSRGLQHVEQAADYGTLTPLPETRDEINAMVKALGADPELDVRFGAQATRAAALTTDLSDRRVLAFATHGLRPGDLPGLSRPALAMAAGGPGDSPLLVLDDVLTMKLNADWVVLSACNTASGDGRALEAFSGLARAFFFAGARSVLATHWAVESLSAQQLVARTFAHQAANRDASRAESLRHAQLELIAGRADPAFVHPFFWAPYALYGDPVQ